MTDLIYCPGGQNSQTGTAVKQRWPEIEIHNAGEKITDVEVAIQNNQPGPYAVPIWNSHQGEVPPAVFVWNLIEDARVKLSAIWAKQIEFWQLKKKEHSSDNNIVGSVLVARTQCSFFLRQNNFELKDYPLTTVAFDSYKNGAELHSVLVAPGQGEDDPHFDIINKQTANPNNFTTFVKLSPFHATSEETSIFLSAVAMRPLKVNLGEAERSFFDSIFNSVTNITEVPKLIFVLKREAKVGLLFEGEKIYSGDFLDAEEIEANDIAVYENAGALNRLYSEELYEMFNNTFQDLISEDFIIHQGVNSCLFICPELGLCTHGYEIETVEPVVRFYINKFFELIDAGVTCSESQQAFFEKHKANWQDKRSEFIQFKTIE